MDLKEKRICIDGVNLQDPAGTGIKTYAITLLNALGKQGAQTSALLSHWMPKSASIDLNYPKDKGPKGYYKNLPRHLLKRAFTARKISRPVNHELHLPPDIAFFNYPRIFDLSNAYFNDFGKPTKLRFDEPIDAFHITSPLALDTPDTAKVTTIHDLIPFTHPETCLIGNPKRLFQKFEYAAHSSDLLLTVSEHSKQDIVEHFNIPAEKVKVTYQTSPFEGVEIDKQSDEYQSTLAKYNLQNKRYLLFIGGIEPKKNLSRLIQAYSKLEINKNTPLIIVGKKAWLFEEVIKTASESPCRENIHFLDYVPFNDLPVLLKAARAFVFPSLYEGFGLPVLEAFNFGCPAITSNISSLPEVCGDAGILVDPYSVDEMAGAMEALIQDDSLRSKLSERTRAQAEKFSSEAYARRLKEAYSCI